MSRGNSFNRQTIIYRNIGNKIYVYKYTLIPQYLSGIMCELGVGTNLFESNRTISKLTMGLISRDFCIIIIYFKSI